MSFGTELEAQFIAETAKISGNVNEEELFKALDRAFENLSSCGAAACKIIHGARHLVRFSELPPEEFYYAKDRGEKVRCELADLLIVAFESNEVRICCMQNKYEPKKTHGMSVTDNFQADMRQFYLLKERPPFERDGKTSNLLKDAICPSVGSYGVFYKNDNGFNMNYHSAAALNGLRPGLIGRSRRIKMNPDEEQIVTQTKGMVAADECQFAENLQDFGDALDKGLVGTPQYLKDGIRALGDCKIFDSIMRLSDGEGSLGSLRKEELENMPQAVSYRTAVVIKCSGRSNGRYGLRPAGHGGKEPLL